MFRHRAILVPYEPEWPGDENAMADGLAFGHVRPQRFPRRGANAAGEQDIRRSDTTLVSSSREGKLVRLIIILKQRRPTTLTFPRQKFVKQSRNLKVKIIDRFRVK